MTDRQKDQEAQKVLEALKKEENEFGEKASLLNLKILRLILRPKSKQQKKILCLSLSLNLLNLVPILMKKIS